MCNDSNCSGARPYAAYDGGSFNFSGEVVAGKMVIVYETEGLPPDALLNAGTLALADMVAEARLRDEIRTALLVREKAERSARLN